MHLTKCSVKINVVKNLTDSDEHSVIYYYNKQLIFMKNGNAAPNSTDFT